MKIDKIKNAATLTTSLFSVVVILWGVFKFVNKTDTQGTTLTEIKQQQTIIIDSISILSQKVMSLEGKVQEVGDNNILIGNYVEGVKAAFDYHITNSPEVTKEDYRKMIMMIDELKKNEQPIAYK